MEISGINDYRLLLIEQAVLQARYAIYNRLLGRCADPLLELGAEQVKSRLDDLDNDIAAWGDHL